MNAISKGRSQAATSRIARGIGVAALSTILVAGLAGCMTGKVAANSEPVVQRNAVAPPAGVELGRPADRIAEQLERGAREVSLPSWTDRITAELDYTARNGQPAKETPKNPYPGVPADRLERLLQPQ